MRCARTEWLGGPTAPPNQLNGADRGIGASICVARSLDPPCRVRSSRARYAIVLAKIIRPVRTVYTADVKDAEMFFLILCRYFGLTAKYKKKHRRREGRRDVFSYTLPLIQNTGGQEGRQRIKEYFF